MLPMRKPPPPKSPPSLNREFEAYKKRLVSLKPDVFYPLVMVLPVFMA